VVTDQVHKGQNLSAIIRTCDAVGIAALHSVYDKATFRADTGTTMGTHKWVDTRIYRNIDEPLTQLKSNNYKIIAAEKFPEQPKVQDFPQGMAQGMQRISFCRGFFSDSQIARILDFQILSFSSKRKDCISLRGPLVICEVVKRRNYDLTSGFSFLHFAFNFFTKTALADSLFASRSATYSLISSV